MSVSSLTAKEIAETGRRLYDRGLIAGSDGNISSRIDDGRILVTPSGKCKGRLAPEDMIVVDQKGKKVGGRLSASSETPMHLHIYRKRPDIHACVHAHPPYATAFAVAGIPLNEKILPEAVLFAGNIALTAYAPPGTSQLAGSLDPYIADHDLFLLQNHGLVAIGKSLEEACNRIETAEHLARILFLARQLGKVNELDRREIARLMEIRQHGGDSL